MTNSIETGTVRPMPPIALVVNDDRDTAEIYERLLSGDGLWVTSCSEREAFEYARDVLPDLILSDLDVRPGAFGRDILQRFRDDPGFATCRWCSSPLRRPTDRLFRRWTLS